MEKETLAIGVIGTIVIIVIIIISGLSLLYIRDSYKPITCPECEECPEPNPCPEYEECPDCLGHNYSLGHDCVNPRTTPANPFPIRYKDSPFEDYCNYEIRCAITWAREYFSRPDKFKQEQYHTYWLWDDYRSRVCPEVDNETRMFYYNYWIISYAFGI